MSPAAEAQSLEASGEAQQEALAQSKARSVISYSPDEIFQKSWQTYQLVVDVGLLGHAKLASAVASRLARLRRARGRALRVLDLGSGDAGSLTRALAAEAASLCPPSSSSAAATASDFIAQYTGVDESRPALALAADNVARHLPGTEGRFFAGDFLAAVERSAPSAAAPPAAAPSSDPSEQPFPAPPEGGYDAILASLSAHHLSTEEGKPALVAAARRALLLPPLPLPPTPREEGRKKEEEASGACSSSSPSSSSSSPSSAGSLLIIADVFLNEDDKDDSVDAWRRRSCAIIREQWPRRAPGEKLSSEEADRIASHVGSCDIPTTVANYASFAREAGFRSCEKVADVEEELGIRVIVMEA